MKEPNSPLQSPTLDLSVLANATGEIKVRNELPEDTDARIRKDAKQHDHEIWKDKMTFWVTIVGAAVILLTSLYFLNAHNSTPQAKDWAAKALPSLVTAALGFLYGKKTGASRE